MATRLRYQRLGGPTQTLLRTEGESGRFEFKQTAEAAKQDVLVAAANAAALEHLPSVTILVGVAERVDEITGAVTGEVIGLGDIDRAAEKITAYGRDTHPVPELLRIHSAVPADLKESEFRRFLMWANSMGYLKYSTKTKTVRVAVEDSAASDVRTPIAPAGVVSPRTPFSNVVRLRRILRDLRGVVWWIDPYFHRQALEELITNLDFTLVSEVRILSSGKASVLTEAAKTDFVQFETEVDMKGSAAHWKQDPSRDWHDRWLFDNSVGYNMPPAELIFSGKKYSEFTPAGGRPPLDKWWSRSKAW